MRWIPAAAALICCLFACGNERVTEPSTLHPPADEPTFVSLSQRFVSARIENPVQPTAVETEPHWSFEGGTDHGWHAIHGVSELTVRGGRLSGRTGELPLLVSSPPPELDAGDLLHAVELRIRVSEGAAQHPEVVERLKTRLAGWHQMAVASRVEAEADAANESANWTNRDPTPPHSSPRETNRTELSQTAR